MSTKKQAGPKTPRVTEMATNEEIAARQADSDAQDGRYHHVFTVSAASEDWEAPEHDSMHAANRLAVLDAALHHGLHPQEEARYDGAELIHGNRGRDTTRLSYSVKVLPADQAHAPSTVTVSKELAAGDGTSETTD